MPSLPSSFELHVDFKSDWHVGTGLGRPGDIDALVATDAWGLPYVPGTTLCGVLRDSCESVANALDEGTGRTYWADLVEMLYGDQPSKLGRDLGPRPSLIEVRPAHYPIEFREAVQGQEELAKAFTIVKPGVKIDVVTGRAVDDFLRFVQIARGSVAPLVAHVTIAWPSDEPLRTQAMALWMIGCHMLERLGGKRRRGHGRCVVTVPEAALLSQWVAAIENPPPGTAGAIAVPTRVQASPGSAWRRVRLHLTATTALQIRERTRGNSIEGLDFIPGTQLLPGLQRRLGAVVPDFREHVASGRILITPAVPADGSEASLPTPLTWSHDKVGGGLALGRGVYNRAVESWPAGDGKARKPMRSGWVGQAQHNGYPRVVTIERSVRAHNVIDDAVQRPTEAVGGLYAAVAMNARTELVAEVLIAPDVDLPADWVDRLSGPWRVGAASKSEYGLVKVCAAEVPLPQHSTDLQPDSELTVFLSSDCLLRDAALRPTSSPTALRDALSAALGVRLSEECADERLKISTRVRRLEGWNTTWQLPTASKLAIKAGSVFRYTVKDKLSRASLEKVEIEGLGERRAEGFGRVLFNDQRVLTAFTTLTGGAASRLPGILPVPVPKTNVRSWDQAKKLDGYRLEEEIARRALAMGTPRVLGFVPGQKPGNSQASGLRQCIARYINPEDAKAVRNWVEALGQSASARRWPDDWQAKSGPGNQVAPFGKVLLDLLEGDAVWTCLGLPGAWPMLAENSFSILKNELRPLAVRALVDAAIRAHRTSGAPDRADAAPETVEGPAAANAPQGPHAPQQGAGHRVAQQAVAAKQGTGKLKELQGNEWIIATDDGEQIRCKKKNVESVFLRPEPGLRVDFDSPIGDRGRATRIRKPG